MYFNSNVIEIWFKKKLKLTAAWGLIYSDKLYRSKTLVFSNTTKFYTQLIERAFDHTSTSSLTTMERLMTEPNILMRSVDLWPHTSKVFISESNT